MLLISQVFLPLNHSYHQIALAKANCNYKLYAVLKSPLFNNYFIYTSIICPDFLVVYHLAEHAFFSVC